jgi:hypothetical protein
MIIRGKITRTNSVAARVIGAPPDAVALANKKLPDTDQ